MQYKVKSVAALQTLLGGWPDRMRVETDRGITLSAKTVGELRKVSEWPANLAITTPPEPDPESTIKVSKATLATRLSPKS
jgi:hypothetical protein